MPFLTRLKLVAALLLAVLQLARVGIEWMDVAHTAGTQPVVVHVEELGGSDHCPPVHSLDCVICAGLSTPALPSCASEQAPLVATRSEQATAAAVFPGAGVSGHPYDSRAPPVG